MDIEPHSEILRQGATVWNQWRKENPNVKPQLQHVNLDDAYLAGANLTDADFSGAYLFGTNFQDCELVRANFEDAQMADARLTLSNASYAVFRRAHLAFAELRNVNFSHADLSEAGLGGVYARESIFEDADLSGAKLNGSDFRASNFVRARLPKVFARGANFSQCVLDGADLTGANLAEAILVGVSLKNAYLKGSNVYGVAAWDVDLTGTDQSDLVLAVPGGTMIQIDSIRAAQFAHLLIRNANIHDVINTVASKVVLLLGRFSLLERKAVLEGLRTELSRRGYIPIVFDFDRPIGRDIIETVLILAGMSLFVIADVTGAKSTPLELQATVPNFMIPFVPIIQHDEKAFSMLSDLRNQYPDRVLQTLEYDDMDQLRAAFDGGILQLALRASEVLHKRKGIMETPRKAADYVK